MPKFTEGPWAVEVDSTCSGAWFNILDSDGNEIAQTESFAVCAREMVRYYGSRSTLCAFQHEPEAWDRVEEADAIEANAQLISAAPELYESVKNLYDQISGLIIRKKINDFDLSGSGLGDDLETAVAALAKARGEK